ncbi:MAG: DUF4115 domain-containing protein [Chloroflexota bacterium]|nr:DUF4115 domain-containing protein [Chloroflexota bacterium]
MNELGSWLRETREAQNFSLAEVEDRTRIRQKFLAAMEAEEWSLLPGDVTTRGFLRKYAAFLGMDPDEVIELYQQRGLPPDEVAVLSEPLEERPLDYRPIEMELAEQDREPLPWRWIGLAALAALMAIGALYVLTFQRNWIPNVAATLPDGSSGTGIVITEEETAEATATRIVLRVTATPTDTPTDAPKTTPTDVPKATPAPETGNAVTTGNNPTAEPEETVAGETPTPPGEAIELSGDGLTLAVEATQRSWIRVITDGTIRYEGILEKGDQNSWQGQETIVLRTGNAAGLMATLNERLLDRLGGRGEVVQMQWSIDGKQIAETTPTPTATQPAETG